LQELSKDKKQSVGVIGYPNVGKSTFIASLKNYLSKPETDCKNIKLQEEAGVIFGEDKTNSLMLKTVKSPDDLDDPFVHVHALTKRVPKHELLLLYEIADFANTEEFLAQVAKKKGRYLKRGVPDYDSAAKLILNDWLSGFIPYSEDCPYEDVILV
jgi:ribosome biogenesis GTPase A